MPDRRPPQLRIAPIMDPGSPPRLVQCVYAFSPAWYTIHWGDTHRTPSKPNLMEEHSYAEPGTYQIAIVLDGDVEPHATGFIRVRDTMLPQVSLALGDDPRFSDMVYFINDESADDGTGTRAYHDVHWGDGSKTERVLCEPGIKTVWHGYNAEGDYTIRIIDRSTKRFRDIPHTVAPPAYDPDYRLEYDPAHADKMTAKVTVTKIRPSSEGEVKLDWGDASELETVPNEVGHITTHTYDTADAYFVTMYYPGGGQYKRTIKFFEAGGEQA